MKDLEITYVSPDALLAYSGNPRIHSQQQVKQIARSIRKRGFLNPVLIDSDNRLIAGHGRVLGAKDIGLPRIPAIRVEHLNETEKRAYLLADNKLAENADWDPNLLRVELKFLMELDFDLDLTGFATPEIDVIMQPAEGDPEDPIPEPRNTNAIVSKPGDIWCCGPHRLANGDAREPALLKTLLGDRLPRMIITDPPYNVPVAGHVSGLGKHHHDEFAMASGEMSPEQFVEFLRSAFGTAIAHCMDGALVFSFMDWRHLHELQIAFAALKLDLINLCIWAKTNAGMGSLYRSQHELILIGKNGDAPHVNNVELGKHGRYRSNLWSYHGMNVFGAERDEALATHPTPKPVALVADAIRDVSHHDDIVLDMFLGSGTTLIAAERCHRRCYGVELDPRYVDVTLQRWRNLTGRMPTLASTGETFVEVKKSRCGIVEV